MTGESAEALEVLAPGEPSRSRASAAAPEPLLVPDEVAAAMLGIGVSYFRGLLTSGAIGPQPVRLGRRQLHRPDLLKSWVLAGMPDRATWLAAQRGGRS